MHLSFKVLFFSFTTNFNCVHVTRIPSYYNNVNLDEITETDSNSMFVYIGKFKRLKKKQQIKVMIKQAWIDAIFTYNQFIYT